MSLIPDPVSTVKNYAIGAAFVALIGVIGWLYVTRAHDEVLLSENKVLIDQYRSSNEDFADKSKKANAAMAAVITASNLRADQSVKAVHAAQVKANAAYASAAKLAKAKPTDPDDCKATNALINAYLGGAQ